MAWPGAVYLVNIGPIDFIVSAEQLAVLKAASRPDLPMLYRLFGDEMRRQVTCGGATVCAR